MNFGQLKPKNGILFVLVSMEEWGPMQTKEEKVLCRSREILYTTVLVVRSKVFLLYGRRLCIFSPHLFSSIFLVADLSLFKFI